MREIKITRNLFLWCMSLIYLSAFSSLYVQLPGLFGDNGILPARGIISLDKGVDVVKTKSKEIPTLLWLAPTLGIDVHYMLDVIALLGIIVSFGCVVWSRMRDMANFTLLWTLYFSLFQVGHTFLWFQWDTLLLEVGFLTVFIAPLCFLQRSKKSGGLSSLPSRAHDRVSMWLVRWLLFRFMFASGVVKLTSMCPTWWNLSALYYHFESQCIPTPLAWYAHFLSKKLLKLGVVGTFIIEIPIPFLFFSPIRSLRLFSFYVQVLFQLLIILTGNYNFFNLITITMCLSLVDDDFLLSLVGRPPISSKPSGGNSISWTRRVATFTMENIVKFCLMYGTVKYFSLSFHADWSLDSKIAFSSSQFRSFLTNVMPLTIFIGAASLFSNIILAIYRSLSEPGILKKITSVMSSFIICSIAVWLFIISMIPHTALDPVARKNLWPIVHQWHKRIDEFHLSNSYGLFRRMTGVKGRPEIVIEGSNSLTTGWKEYHFLYKPGDESQPPPFLIPHQPRLDWQMWFAALGNYEQNPWFISLMYRMLDGEVEVLKLFDMERLPFPVNKPPKYVRAILYHYGYVDSKTNDGAKRKWWKRGKVREYFNSNNMDEKQMAEFLNNSGIPMEKTRYLRITNQKLKKFLVEVRRVITSFQPTTFVWSLISTGLCINFMVPLIRFMRFI